MKLSIKQYIFLIINILAYNTLLRNFWKEGLTWSIVCDWIIPILVILFTNTVSLVIVIKMVDKKKTQHRLTIKSQGADDHIGPVPPVSPPGTRGRFSCPVGLTSNGTTEPSLCPAMWMKITLKSGLPSKPPPLPIISAWTTETATAITLTGIGGCLQHRGRFCV